MLRTLAIGLLGIVLVHGNVAAQTPQEQEKILRAFQMNVEDYTEQHNSFDLIPSAPAAATVAARIFTMPVATVFRQLIARTLDEQAHASHMVSAGNELPLERHPVTFEPFPATELYEFPELLARALPPLPRTLEYRLIGHDLVLRDVDGDVIVAVLRDAVGQAATTQR
jgi:hypothetical protein